MVKVVGPGMSLDASGSLAGTLVFSKWKGRNYIRQLVTPANPRAVKQVSVRAMFKFLTQRWAPDVSDADQLTWAGRADDMIVSPFNAYLSYNLNGWRNFLGPAHMEDPDRVADDMGNINFVSHTGGVGLSTLEVDVVNGQRLWGILVFRSTTSPITIAFDNLIGILPIQGAATYKYVDTPLDAGTYYYRYSRQNWDGNAPADWEAQETVVVT